MRDLHYRCPEDKQFIGKGIRKEYRLREPRKTLGHTRISATRYIQLHLDFHRAIWQYRSRPGRISLPILRRYSPALKGLQME